MTEEEENQTAEAGPLNCGGMTETNKRHLHHGLFALLQDCLFFFVNVTIYVPIIKYNHNLDYKLSTNHENTNSSL